MGGGCCCLGPGSSCAFGGVCGRVAILTPYKEQKRSIENELSAVFGGRAWEHAVDVCSVDSYQGKEKEVRIYGASRAGDRDAISSSYCSSSRRLAVSYCHSFRVQYPRLILPHSNSTSHVSRLTSLPLALPSRRFLPR